MRRLVARRRATPAQVSRFASSNMWRRPETRVMPQVELSAADIQCTPEDDKVAPPMFATAASRNASSVYRLVDVETGVATASAHRLVAMLFDGFFDAVAQARGALLAGRIEDKGRAIGRAVRIVEEGLRSGLDRQGGGEIASRLNGLYGYVALRLTEANLNNDAAALEECASLLEPVRSAWLAIDPKSASKPQ
jgi:flagellar protein FliS